LEKVLTKIVLNIHQCVIEQHAVTNM